MYSFGYTFPMVYRVPQTKIVCKSYTLGEVDVSTTSIRAHKPFGVSSPRVRVLDV
jgi:hypothetical protein